MRAEDVLDCQGELLDRLTEPRFSESIRMTVAEQYDALGQRYTEHRRLDAALDHVPALLGRALRSASAYHVSRDMAAVVMGASAGLDDLDRWFGDLAPTRSGFVRIEGGLPVDDARGREMRIDWLVWSQTISEDGQRATGMWYFNDQHDDPDEITRALWERHGREHVTNLVGRWGFIGLDMAGEEMRLGPAYVMPAETHVAKIVAEGGIPAPYRRPHRYLYALWMLLGQTLTDARDADLPRPFVKRAVRRRLPPRVTVIRLRHHASAPAEGESLVDWSCRWLVREYRRWQHYGPRAADHEHEYGAIHAEAGRLVRRCVRPGCEGRLEHIYVAPHIKGPEGKPLRLTNKVYDLVE